MKILISGFRAAQTKYCHSHSMIVDSCCFTQTKGIERMALLENDQITLTERVISFNLKFLQFS